MSLVSLVKLQRVLAKGDAKRWGENGNASRKLRRYLERRERALKVELFVRLPSEKRTELKVDVGVLKRHCPELFPKGQERLKVPDEMRGALAVFVKGLIREHHELEVETRLRNVEDAVGRVESA